MHNAGQIKVNTCESADNCDFCARTGVRIKRRHLGLRYCATCYAREFKPRACTGCGDTARLPIDQPTAVCRACERRTPCFRCGKVDERRGRTTAEGRACNTCVQRLRPAEPCELCGTPSNRLSRNSSLGHDLRVCPRCARAAHGTCAACGRHRPVEEATDGRQLCRPCREEGERPCETCDRVTPAGYGRHCRTCEATERARRRIGTIAGSVEPGAIAERFAAFGEWLIETAGPEKAVRDAVRHASLFAEIGETWDDIPDYAELVDHFGAEGLRRQRRVMRWMTEQDLVSVDPAIREDGSERRRIAESMERLPKGSRAAVIVNDYCTKLDEHVRAGKLSRRSMRLSMTPAATLLATALAAGRELPSQETLDAVLRETPGQRAALTGFVRWLRETHDIPLALPPRRAATELNQRRARARQEMLALLREGAGGNDFAKRWRTTALRYFHDVAVKRARQVREDDVQMEGGGLCVNIRGESCWIPGPPNGTTDRAEG